MTIKKGTSTIATGGSVDWGSIEGTLSDQTDLYNILIQKASTLSPVFTGAPTAPTASPGTNTKQIATTAFVKNALDNVDALPDQTDMAGKYLTTDGTTAYWKSPAGLPLLAHIWSDHILNDASYLRADTFSWQDGGVYSSAYNELLSEYNNASSTFQSDVYKENIIKVGSLTDNDGVISGFSSSNYAALPESFSPSSNTWERGIKFTTGNITSNSQVIMGNNGDYKGCQLWISTTGLFYLGCSSNNSSWNIGNVSGSSAAANTTYWARIKYTGSSYTLELSTDGETYTTDIIISSNTAVSSSTIWLGTHGSAPFEGSIDIKESYIKIDGDIWWKGCSYTTYKKTPKGYKIADVSQAENVAYIYNSVGAAWYYIIDTTNSKFKLPRTKFGFVGLRDNAGNYVEPGLPNITGSFQTLPTYSLAFNGTTTGAIYTSDGNITAGALSGSYTRADTLGIDASRSNSIYGNSNTVQPPATQMYLYFFVGNTVRNETEIDVGEITEALDGKLDQDLSNASANFKETVVGWVMPDYTAGVNLGEPTTYQTLPCDCYVTYQADTGSGVGSQGFYYTNPDESYEGVFRQALTYNRIGLGLYLQKGWKVKRYESSSTIIYYPLKGTQNV